MVLSKDINKFSYWNNDLFIGEDIVVNERYNNQTVFLYFIKSIDNNIIKKINFNPTNKIIGILYDSLINKIIYIHCKYVNNKSYLYIEYYELLDNYLLNLKNTLKFENIYTVDETIGKIEKLDKDYFVLIYGSYKNSLFNYLAFNYMDNSSIYKIFVEPTLLYKYYFLSKTDIIESTVLGFSNNKLHIYIKPIDSESLVYCKISNIDINYFNSILTHRYDLETELESIILQIYSIGHKVYGLIRVKIESKLDILHLEEYFIDILIDITNRKIIEITDKLHINSIIDYVSEIIESNKEVKIFNKHNFINKI